MRDKRKFEQLTDKKRWKLHELRGQGCSMRTCARELGVNVSTVSRELDRNAAEVGGGNVYLPDHAILCTKGRRARCHPHVKMNDPSFRRMIVIEINKGWKGAYSSRHDQEKRTSDRKSVTGKLTPCCASIATE